MGRVFSVDVIKLIWLSFVRESAGILKMAVFNSTRELFMSMLFAVCLRRGSSPISELPIF